MSELDTVPDAALLAEVRRRGLGLPNNAPPVRHDWRLVRPDGHPEAVPAAVNSGDGWYLCWVDADGEDELRGNHDAPEWPFAEDAIARASDLEALGFAVHA